MKKYHNKAVSKILCAVLAFFTLVTAAAYAAEYSVSIKNNYVSYVEQNGERIAKQIKIDGNLSHNTVEKVFGYMYDSNKKLVDIVDAESDENGDFTLTFTPGENVSDGMAEIKVSSLNCVNEATCSVTISNLGAEAVVESFSINGKGAEISGGEIKIVMDNWTDLRSLSPKFTLSQGAELYLNGEKQISGESKVDFTKNVSYKIVSEDLKTEAEYSVGVKNPKESQTSGGGKSSGGGGGGGGGASVFAPTKPVENKPDTKDDEKTFYDLDGFEWAKDYINSLSSKKVINGFGDGTFKPGNKVTREEFVKMLVVALNLKGDIKLGFNDVDSTHWAYEYIKKAVSAGVVNGISDTEFGINTAISRQDMAVMAYRAAKKVGKLNNIEPDKNNFSDESDIADYAKDAIAYMKSAGIINGVGENMFNPLGTATRAETAVVISKIIDGGAQR